MYSKRGGRSLWSHAERRDRSYAVLAVGCAPQDGYGFWYYACYFFLFVSLLTYMAQFLAAAMPNQQVASSLGMAYLSMTSNVSGFAIRPQDIPGGWMCARRPLSSFDGVEDLCRS